MGKTFKGPYSVPYKQFFDFTFSPYNNHTKNSKIKLQRNVFNIETHPGRSLLTISSTHCSLKPPGAVSSPPCTMAEWERERGREREVALIRGWEGKRERERERERE